MKVAQQRFYLLSNIISPMLEEVMTSYTEKLDRLIKSGDSHLHKAERGIRLCNTVLSKLQHQIEQEDFENTKSEIHFFKNIKPYPMSYLIYFTEVRSCELTIPKAGSSNKVRFLEKEIKKINKFFVQNNDFVHYMEQDHNYLDHQFFTRNFRDTFPFTPTINYYQYPEFSTSHDMLWAKVQAMYRLIHYIREKLDRLKPDQKLDFSLKPHKVMVWSGSKTALVELAYAIHADGDLNFGTIDIKTIIRSFEDIFNIKLDNFYKTYSEIKARKEDRTKFLNQLVLKLETKMRRDDAS